MKIPNAAQALIDQEKMVAYLLNPDHQRGGSKAALLMSFGYSSADWRQLADALRLDHLSQDILRVRETLYGSRYEIRALLRTPIGRPLMLRSVWQIDNGTDIPRLITAYPD
ncbi:MAG: hypothetical protein SH847_20530 [Roseiflexaceae bacterium]|nr:hypothetical protein [Roseiflexaceae bacterium]